ncbi:glycoside hydrolase family 43 protein [Treponema sp.]|uniref:glycoside hydrolase family 43 protein n=1 Tax=Treponema sp. TaxID=166 RepID=UPI0025D66086|nr:glycoside hydrolase family 43 protein [Treponema sp.]MBR4323427.1 glycoside hydrolase family 43 protein [Treponema sp.]
MKKIKVIGGTLAAAFILLCASCSTEATEKGTPTSSSSNGGSSSPSDTTTVTEKGKAGDSSITSGWDYVKTKYSSGIADAAKSQTGWNAVNCHDPKLFQDDDGTYYVYSTDASCGNIGYVGIHIRYSDDLVSWKGHNQSALNGYWDEELLRWEDYTASSAETKQNDSSYTAYTWAPTVVKLNDLYYMYHGVNADVGKDSSGNNRPASAIVLAIASNAKGPFYPASFISKYTAGSDKFGNDSDILSIKAKLESLGVSYSQNFLARHIRVVPIKSLYRTPSLDGKSLENPDYTDSNFAKSNNSRFGCIDPEFVYDVATGNLMEYTIGGNECYAMIYGSWMSGISLIYVDKVSLKQVANTAFTYDGKSYSPGDELDIPLDEANTSQSANSYGLCGVRIAGGYGAGYEGAQLFFNSETNYYYLITSCGGLDYEYRCTCSRSQSIDGEYVDAGGQSMLLNKSNASGYHAYGSKIIGSHALEGENSFRCQGGLSVWRNTDGQIIFACHARTNFQMGYYFYLQCHQMFFNEEGWPVLNQNEFYSDYTSYTADGKESLSKLELSDIAGDYDTILTVRGTEKAAISSLGIYGASDVSDKANKADAVPTASKTMTLNENGTISGTYTGDWSLADDGYSITINLKDASGNAMGVFKGYALHAVDWARSSDYRTITFTTICSDASASEGGEYFWGNKQAASRWSLSSDENTLTYDDSSNENGCKNLSVPKFDVSSASAFSFEFKANLPLSTKDWEAKILSYSGCYVTIPNLDPWNNTISSSNLKGKNSYPTADGASLSNGLEYTSAFDGKDHTIKISFTTNTITFYLDGKTWVTYSSSALSNGMEEFVGYYKTALTNAALIFNEAGLNITNLAITKDTN